MKPTQIKFGTDGWRGIIADDFRTLVFDRPSPTQVASWTVIDSRATGAVAITASHNPYQYNGYKYKTETGSAVSTDIITELERYINALDEVGVPERTVEH